MQQPAMVSPSLLPEMMYVVVVPYLGASAAAHPDRQRPNLRHGWRNAAGQ